MSWKSRLPNPHRVYQALVQRVDPHVPSQLRPFWNSEAGPKTVFFWAPSMKWLLVLAGVSDLNRPPSQISVNQTAALAATGAVWSRYSMVITPKNYLLLSVNCFVALTNVAQLLRVAQYRASHFFG